MNKKEIAAIFIGSLIVCYALGYALGVTKVLMFQSTRDGKNAYVYLCDVDGEFRDENDNCRNFNKVKISLGKASSITGRRWGNYGVAVGFVVGFGIASNIENRKDKKRKGVEI